MEVERRGQSCVPKVETVAVIGQAKQIEGGDGARLVPRLLGLSGHTEGWLHDPVATSAPCPIHLLLPLSQFMRKRHFDKRPEATNRIGPSLYALYLYILVGVHSTI